MINDAYIDWIIVSVPTDGNPSPVDTCVLTELTLSLKTKTDAAQLKKKKRTRQKEKLGWRCTESYIIDELSFTMIPGVHIYTHGLILHNSYWIWHKLF
jgi:hypothetical protein